jgi:hypothetical protein
VHHVALQDWEGPQKTSAESWEVVRFTHIATVTFESGIVPERNDTRSSLPSNEIAVWPKTAGLLTSVARHPSKKEYWKCLCFICHPYVEHRLRLCRFGINR